MKKTNYRGKKPGCQKNPHPSLLELIKLEKPRDSYYDFTFKDSERIQQIPSKPFGPVTLGLGFEIS